VCVCDDKIANLNRFKQNLHEANTITVRNFVRKLKIDDVLIVEFLVLQITISNVVSEKRKFDDYDYLHRFLLRFLTLVDVYRGTFLAENQLLN